MAEGVREQHEEVRRSEETASPVPQRAATIPVQAKLSVGAANDPLEAEADRVAAEVSRILRSGGADVVDSGDGRIARTAAVVPPAARVVTRISRAASVGLEGGDVDADTESRIQASRGRGSRLAPAVEASMGQAFGADFSSVRVHTGSESTELNNRIQAKAFTIGSDVFFRDGVPDTSSTGGQELLAHELSHTIQQGGAAQRKADSSGTARVQRASSATIRRVPALTLLPAEVRKPDAADPTKIDEGSTGLSQVTISPGDDLDVDFAITKQGKTSQADFVKVRSVDGNDLDARGFDRYVKKSAVADKKARATPPGKTNGTEQALGKAGATVGVIPEINDAQDAFKSNGNKVEASMESGMGVAAGAGDTIAMFTGIAAAIVAFRSSEASGSDKAGAVLSGISSLGGGVKGVSSMADKGGAGKDATSGAQGIAGFADAFAGIKDTFFVIKHIVELANEAEGLNDKEKFKASMEIISEAMSAAKSGVSSAKAFMELWGGGAAAPLMNAVPGLGIALSAVDVIVRAVDLVDALIVRNDMQNRKRALKTSAALGGKQGTSLKKEAEAFIKSIDAKRKAGKPVTKDEETKYAQYEEYLLAKGLQYISSKRANRALLKIGVAMGKIAGDVAVLGGASAPVGVGIKAGAMALDVGASLFRRFKQWGRDTAAEKEKTSGAAATGFWSLFNTGKSTEKKLEGYNRMVDKVFDMVVKVTTIADADEQAAAAEQVKAFVGAMGLSIKQMDAKKGDPNALRLAMITAMKKRE